jgi:hypothetical protein
MLLEYVCKIYFVFCKLEQKNKHIAQAAGVLDMSGYLQQII